MFFKLFFEKFSELFLKLIIKKFFELFLGLVIEKFIELFFELFFKLQKKKTTAIASEGSEQERVESRTDLQ